MVTPRTQGWGDPCDQRTLTTVEAAGHRWRVREELARIVAGFVTEWHREIEPLDPAQCWSYACRLVRGATTTSYHAWGLALDLNAVLHPLGKRGTFTRKQVTKIRALCSRYGFRWGGDFRSRADEMHVEFAGTRTDAARITAALEEDDDMTPEDRAAIKAVGDGVKELRRAVARAYNLLNFGRAPGQPETVVDESHVGTVELMAELQAVRGELADLRSEVAAMRSSGGS